VSILAGMLAVTVFVSGCSKQGGGLLSANQKVATVDGAVITKNEYDKAYKEFQNVFSLDKLPEQQRVMLGETVKQMTLNKLIYEALLDTEASKAGIKVTDADVQKYKQEKIFSNPALKEQFKQFLAQRSMTEADFDAQLKDTLLQNKFVEAKGGPQVQVSDSEVKAFYDKNPDQFKLPERIAASHILVKAIVPEMKRELREKNPKITDAEVDKTIAGKEKELEGKAAKLFSQVKAEPKKFEELAKANSDDAVSAQRGGDLGQMVESNIDPVFWAAIQKTPNGQLYPSVLHTQFGYHIIKVGEHLPPKKEDFQQAKPMISDFLSQQKKQAFLQQWVEQKKNEAKIVIEPAYQPKAQPAPAAAQQMPAAPQAVAPQEGGAAAPAAPAAEAPKAAHQ
jgi:parvulin-like peptidyl-prolyl isomerase